MPHTDLVRVHSVSLESREGAYVALQRWRDGVRWHLGRRDQHRATNWVSCSGIMRCLLVALATADREVITELNSGLEAGFSWGRRGSSNGTESRARSRRTKTAGAKRALTLTETAAKKIEELQTRGTQVLGRKISASAVVRAVVAVGARRGIDEEALAALAEIERDEGLRWGGAR